MKRSTLAYGALGIAILAAGGVWQWERTHQPVHIVKLTPLLPNFHAEQVAKIEIEQMLDGLVIEKTGDHWEVHQTTTALRDAVRAEAASPTPSSTPTATPIELPDLDQTSYPADAAQMQSAFNALRTSITTGLVARSGAQQDALQVGKLALRVRALDAIGTELVNIRIGKQGPDFLSSYVRIGSRTDVYLVRDQLRARFPTQIANWRDKLIWQLDADQIASVAITRRTGNFAITKGEDQLFRRSDLATAGALDQLKVRDWFALWKVLSADDVPMHITDDAAGIARSKEGLRVTMHDGKEYALVIGNPTASGGYYAALEGHNTIYTLSTSFKPIINVDIDDWKTDEVPETPAPHASATTTTVPATEPSPHTSHSE